MTINEAKQQVKYAVESYLTRDKDGAYVIPVSAQRPVFVMGPPGIGKTEIMKQVAEELGIGLVSYSMTHHTRQSALGLPTIVKKQYQGQEYVVSEYTMSEILSTVYDVVEENGVTEGILFLDEINCVSETLAPAMLQFLQFKTFGCHKVPDGWVVVTAGNPPEYNNSVREFDIVTWDRLKRMDVEPNFAAWKIYASKAKVHPAILAYLDMRDSEFYQVETVVDGKKFVTARGWVDLSRMIRIYEEKNFPVDYTLVAQYLQNEEIARGFSTYYELFKKYQTIYLIADILGGDMSENTLSTARRAEFGEQMALVVLIKERMFKEIECYWNQHALVRELVKDAQSRDAVTSTQQLGEVVRQLRTELQKKHQAGSCSTEENRRQESIMTVYETLKAKCEQNGESVNLPQYAKCYYLEQQGLLKKMVAEIQEMLSNGLCFIRTVFAEAPSQVHFLLLNDLSNHSQTLKFLSIYPVEEYVQFSGTLLLGDEREALLREIEYL